MTQEQSYAIKILLSDEWEVPVFNLNVANYLKFQQLPEIFWHISSIVNELIENANSPFTYQELYSRYINLHDREVSNYIFPMYNFIMEDYNATDVNDIPVNYMEYINFVEEGFEFRRCISKMMFYAFSMLVNSLINIYNTYGMIGFITDVYPTNDGYILELSFNREDGL